MKCSETVLLKMRLASVSALILLVVVIVFINNDKEVLNIGWNDLKCHIRGDKYDLSFIKESADITMENKLLCIEDGLDSSFYMEIQKSDNDYAVSYDIGGYHIGIFNINGLLTGFTVIADVSSRYQIEGDIADSVVMHDVEFVSDIMHIDYETAHIIGIYEGYSGPGMGPDVEDVVILSDARYGYAIYLNPDTGKCKRIQVILYENDRPNEELYIVMEDVQEVMIPQTVLEIEDEETIAGNDFTQLVLKFIIGAISNSGYIGHTNITR